MFYQWKVTWKKAQTMPANEIDCFLFDLGGVLVHWDGVVPLVDLANGRLTLDQARRFWLESPWVIRFETGQCSREVFARGVVDELGLTIHPSAFLEAFRSWDKGPLPGAAELLHALKQRWQVACLSNNNELHWSSPALRALASPFDPCILSFEVGLMKPDRAIYELAVRRIGRPPHKIVCFDDNPECVEAAKGAGLQAFVAKGVDGVRARLIQLSIPIGHAH